MLNRTAIFLIIHVIVLFSIFALRALGVATDYILVTAVAVMSIETIYMALFTKAVVNKTSDSLNEIKREMAQIREDAYDTAKLQRALIYAGHQIKTIQGDLDLLKKGSQFKSNGNGHHRRAHPIVSQS